MAHLHIVNTRTMSHDDFVSTIPTQPAEAATDVGAEDGPADDQGPEMLGRLLVYAVCVVLSLAMLVHWLAGAL